MSADPTENSTIKTVWWISPYNQINVDQILHSIWCLGRSNGGMETSHTEEICGIACYPHHLRTICSISGCYTFSCVIIHC